MSKFLTGSELDSAICDIIWKAEHVLLIVSPFIKLDDYFKKIFKNHINNPKIHIIIVFGKNENNKDKSLSKEDFEFFKDFLNISIVYVPNLHAKYYGNEKCGVITSINLHDYSFKNNIEFGVYDELSFINNFKKSTDDDAFNTCKNIADNNEAVFIKRPMYEKKLLSLLLGKNYVKSEVLLDNTDRFYSNKSNVGDIKFKTIVDFPEEIELGSKSNDRPSRDTFVIEKNDAEEINQPKTVNKSNKYLRPQKIGYCIRTGEEIKFDIEKPYSYEAFLEWSGNVFEQENYCHYSGEKSRGETCFNKPILKKYWRKAQEEFDL